MCRHAHLLHASSAFAVGHDSCGWRGATASRRRTQAVLVHAGGLRRSHYAHRRCCCCVLFFVRPSTPTCALPPLQVMPSLEDYAAMYARYFVWTVARNPWARAVSSYRMLSRYMKVLGGGGGAAVCSCVLCKLAASGMARRRCKTGGGAEFAPGACLLPPAAPHLPPPPARSVWCYVQHGCKDRVGGWNTVCMDVNHIPRVHNVYPLCTIDRWVGEAVSRVGASAGSGAAAQQQQQRQCGPLPVQRLGARGAGLKQ